MAALVIAIPWFASSTFFDHPAFWWLGLSSIPPHSNDYVPVFPWFGAVLAGIALAQFAGGFSLTERLAAIPLPGTSPLQFIGRHSLAFYLIHQPVLIAAVWTYAQFAPAEQQPPEVQFRSACEAQCRPVRDEEFCTRYCVCMLDELERAGIKEQVLTTDLSVPLRAQLQNIAGACTGRTDEGMGGAQ
jgi:uncharacterized membrane protein